MDEDPEAPRDFKSFGVRKVQDRAWVEQKIRLGQDKALLKHLMLYHAPGPCPCGHPSQELVDRMDWSRPSSNAFTYQTAYREYPRMLRVLPGLDHSAYVRMYLRFHDVPRALTFVAKFMKAGTFIPFELVDDAFRERGGPWTDATFKAWASNPQSTKTLQFRTWSACSVLAPIVEGLKIADVMCG